MVEPAGPSQRDGELFRGEGCCVSDGWWWPPTRVQIFPGVQLSVSSARQRDRILAALAAPGSGPSLGNVGLAWWMGALGLPESCSGLCQGRRSKTAQPSFHAFRERACSLPPPLAVGLQGGRGAPQDPASAHWSGRGSDACLLDRCAN